MDLSIIIVNYNTSDLTIQAIKSIYQSHTKYSYEIFVVDNASSDHSVKLIEREFSDINMIINNKNVGFSRANNQAIKKAIGKYILLLNSDTVIKHDTIEIMLDFMNRETTVGASGCKVVLPDGSLDKACRRGFPTPSASFYYMSGLSRVFPKSVKFNQYHLSYLDENEANPIDCLVGAFMLVRKDVVDEVGLLDETFFMYGEDIDWCYRIKEVGWDIYYYPLTSIVHLKGGSTNKKSPLRLFMNFIEQCIYFIKNTIKVNIYFQLIA